MNILLTNDDGITSPGIIALASALRREHSVFIAAPDSQRSGAAHSLSLDLPLRAFPVKFAGLEDVEAYSVNGTPVDCVKLGVGNLGANPDMVISGVNMGANLGTDVMYSGTVSAAMEGTLMGIPSIAVSVASHRPKHYDAAIDAAMRFIPYMLSRGAGLLNINAPDIPECDIKGIKLTKLSTQKYEPAYIERVDPRNAKYYWTPSAKLTTFTPDEDSDERWINEGYITVTPLLFDITDYRTLEALGAACADGVLPL